MTATQNGATAEHTGWRLGRRPALDGFRGIAILLVMASHAFVPWTRGGGASGVTMFFVLSGFLITSLLMEERLDTGRINLPAFYLRRVLRLIPALVLLLIAVGVYETARYVFGYSSDAKDLPRDMLASLFFVANWFRARGTELGLLSHTWSLAIEEQFYLIWPTFLLLLAPFTRRRQTLTAALLFGLAIAAAAERALLWHGAGSADRVYFGTDTRADSLLLGCGLAVLVHRVSKLRVPSVVVIPGFGLICVATVLAGAVFSNVWNATVTEAGSVIALAYFASAAPGKGWLLESRVLGHIGRISYGLYLWHIPLFSLIDPHLSGLPRAVRIVILFAVAWTVAYASYALVERRFLLRKRAIRARVDPGAALEPV